MKKNIEKRDSLNALQNDIQKTQLILIIVIIIFLSLGGALINVKANDKAFDQNLHNTSEMITRIYHFTKDYSRKDLCTYMDKVLKDLQDVDVISIVNTENIRIYHTNHNLIGSNYDGTHPDFINHPCGFYTENDIGPSGPQRRTYSAVYGDDGSYLGFIMTISLKTTMMSVTIKTIGLFIIVTLVAIMFELAICGTFSKKIKKEFLSFTEDFEGTKFLVDSMRANNHDFTNKLHVILGLIQIGEYDKAVSYIENISIIQRETVSTVMKAIDNSAFAALLIGKIARSSECNVKFVLKDGLCFKTSDVDLPSEALVTITGNLIDNALDAMNFSKIRDNFGQLTFGVFTKPGEMLITVQDNGCGIKDDIKDKVFENGFSTKGNGRGVGLYHTKQLTESLGGTISFESEEGKGTCFVVSLKNRR